MPACQPKRRLISLRDAKYVWSICSSTCGVSVRLLIFKTWEGGYASRPGVIESQGKLLKENRLTSGGTTYCSVAALSMMGTIPEEPAASIRWLLQRQIGGFQGRPGKLEDVCYSFWCGAAITVSLIDGTA
jgi:prenyltransferase beta subunit